MLRYVTSQEFSVFAIFQIKKQNISFWFPFCSFILLFLLSIFTFIFGFGDCVCKYFYYQCQQTHGIEKGKIFLFFRVP